MIKRTNYLLYIAVFVVLFGSFSEMAYCQIHHQQPAIQTADQTADQPSDYQYTIFDFGYIFAPKGLSSYNYEMEYGLKLGAGYDLMSIADTFILHIRFDFTYAKWSSDKSNMIMYLGLRIYLPITDFILLYGEAGPEYRLDDFAGTSSNKFGLAFGAGIDIPISLGGDDNEEGTQLILGFNFRYHYKYHDLMSFTPYIGFRY